LNEQIELANQQVQALKDEFASKDTEVQAKFSEMVTADSLNTSLNLDEQTGTPAPTEQTPEQTPEETPEETETPETVDYTALETEIANSISSAHSKSNVQVTITETTVTVFGDALQNKSAIDYEPQIETALNKGVTYSSQPALNTYVYTIN